MPNYTLNQQNTENDATYISVISFIAAIAIQGGLLLLMWYFCYFSNKTPKAKLIALELGEFTVQETAPQPISEITEDFDAVFEELNPPERNEPTTIKHESTENEPEPIIEEAQAIMEKPEQLIEKPAEPETKTEIPVPAKKIKPKPKAAPKPQPKPVKRTEIKPEERHVEKPAEKPIVQPTKKAENTSAAQASSVSKTQQTYNNETVNPMHSSEQSQRKTSKKAAREADIYIAKVAKLFERNKKYPEIARRKNIKGVVALKFYITNEGKITSCKIINEPDELLANSAIDLITKLKIPKPPKDWEADRPVIYQIKYNIR